jgi:hypothetical protein
MTQNSACTKTISVVATELSDGFQYVSSHGRKVYKENSFITQQIGYIKHSLIFEYLPHDNFNNTDNVKTAQN